LPFLVRNPQKKSLIVQSILVGFVLHFVVAVVAVVAVVDSTSVVGGQAEDPLHSVYVRSTRRTMISLLLSLQPALY